MCMSTIILHLDSQTDWAAWWNLARQEWTRGTVFCLLIYAQSSKMTMIQNITKNFSQSEIWNAVCKDEHKPIHPST